MDSFRETTTVTWAPFLDCSCWCHSWCNAVIRIDMMKIMGGFEDFTSLGCSKDTSWCQKICGASCFEAKSVRSRCNMQLQLFQLLLKTTKNINIVIVVIVHVRPAVRAPEIQFLAGDAPRFRCLVAGLGRLRNALLGSAPGSPNETNDPGMTSEWPLETSIGLVGLGFPRFKS